MYYYKILTLEGNILGYCSSNDLFYYSPKKQKMFRGDESVAQYILLDGSYYYRPDVFSPELEEMKGKYSKVSIRVISKEEYDKAIST